MIILLFSILWGGLLTLILSAPYGYYPLFLGILGASIAMYFISRKHFKIKNKYFYAASGIIFCVSYSICSFIIFKPANFHFTGDANTSSEKKAVIFYCEGEMEKYTPYYANYFLQDTPLLLKPLHSLKIKQDYRKIKVNTKNLDLIRVASEVKNSLLNYEPYYFYIAFSGYVPGLKDSIHQAITDGCGDITIINYSADYELENRKWVKEIFKDIEGKISSLKITKPLHSTSGFSEVYTSLVKNLPMKFDGILIIDEVNDTSSAIKSVLIESGYEDSEVLIEENIHSAMDYFSERGAESLFYMNLKESSSGLNAQTTIPEKIKKYGSNINIIGKESWGYDKRYVISAIELLLDIENKNR